ncbi:Putative peptidoglycan binding domain-containing protein [Microbacterium sp. cf046]|uniref:L,D-transpeptidase family protein n=1 Tax=Microbacterium sp. cf046 TaxID=1761803 RepID=UPI0008E9F2D9|nr:L,D-transpeptidase family protein [Microbacterium sp. cf046]SFR95119.1 Putative peptidoglycan binding domain-containing protein [Microbacterium sp. cf046]
MTDLATRPGAEEAPLGDAADDLEPAATAPIDGSGDAPAMAWAPAEPAPRKRHLALWIGIPAAVAAVAVVASSLVLIAPGTSVAGVPVGGMTPGAAADAIETRLAETTIVLTGAGGDAEVTGADLGASVDATALANAAFAANPAWNPTTWFAAPIDAPVRIDTDAATAALRAAAPELYTDPVDSAITFDPVSAWYVASPSELGTGIDIDAVRAALAEAFAAGVTVAELDVDATPVQAESPTFVAQATVDRLNSMLASTGFYVGAERTVPIDRAVAASWLTVASAERGTYVVTADAAAIQPYVDGLAPLVDRAAENGTVITDSGGDVLREVAPGISGRQLGDTSSVASDFATQLDAGNGVFSLPVTEVAPVITTLARRIEVNLSQQQAFLFENEQVVASWYISSGRDGFNSSTGSFRISAKLESQNMGNPDLTKAPYYYTENVPWVMYYNADEALHGAYWHNNFGNQMSHGCINMPVDAAAYVYTWAPMGTEVWVHY